MLFDTNKHTGNSGLALAIAYFVGEGYVVSVPLNDTQPYDLVVDTEDGLKKVSVKTTRTKSKYGVFIVSVCSCGGTNGRCYARVIDEDIDILAAVTSEGDIYIIPKGKIRSTKTISLGKEYVEYKKTLV